MTAFYHTGLGDFSESFIIVFNTFALSLEWILIISPYQACCVPPPLHSHTHTHTILYLLSQAFCRLMQKEMKYPNMAEFKACCKYYTTVHCIICHIWCSPQGIFCACSVTWVFFYILDCKIVTQLHKEQIRIWRRSCMPW